LDKSLLIQVLVIFAVMLYIQMGKRRVNIIRFSLPIIIVLVVGWKYIHSIPTDGSNLFVLICIAAAAIIFGLLLIMTTTILKENGHYYTKTGLLYGIVLFLSFGIRLGLELYMENNQLSFGQFIVNHHINPDIIGTGFILFIVIMFIVRIIGLLIKIKFTTNRNDMEKISD